MMRDRIRVLLIAAAVLVADQITKWMVVAWIPFQSRIEIVDNFLALNHVRNRGAAFGLFADAPSDLVRVGLIVVSVLAVALIWAYAREGWHQPRIVLAFGLILGGAVGNLADRLHLRYVVDFIDVHWGQWHWPSFNVADAAITVGAVTLFIAMARVDDIEEEEEQEDTAATPIDTDDLMGGGERAAEDPPTEDPASLH